MRDTSFLSIYYLEFVANRPADLSLFSLVTIVAIVIITAGIYFEYMGLTSSGPVLSRWGISGTGTLSGKGMMFCGLVILGAALIIRPQGKKGNKK